MNKGNHLHNFFHIVGDEYATLNQNILALTKLPRIKDCETQIPKKNIFEIIPYELSMIKQFRESSGDKKPIISILKRK